MSICLVVGNWKMNKSVSEARELASAIAARVGDGAGADAGVEIVVCPPYVALDAVGKVLAGSRVAVGAQNLHSESHGAFTGEVSAPMLVDICQYVIVGHSERRSQFGEADMDINLKVKAALDAGLRPILCVGEDLDQRGASNANAVVEEQLCAGLRDAPSAGRAVVAYEPVWAIGTGKSATPQVAQEMMAHIRATLAALCGAEAAAAMPLLYGGSVNAGNAGDYIRQPDVNGVLVGGASLDADSFADIARVAASIG